MTAVSASSLPGPVADLLAPEHADAASVFLRADRLGLDWQAITDRIADSTGALEPLKSALSAGSDGLTMAFLHGQSASSLVQERARLVDLIVEAAWQQTCATALPEAALVAVGGYGRGELHPCSDIDLLLLLDDATDPKAVQEPVAALFTLLWDVGLELGHATRSVQSCVEESHRDLSTATNLQEARLLTGSATLFGRMQSAVGPDQIWPVREFLRAKLKEQEARHAQYDDTPYKLEPNVKNGPGCLRDVQTISWISQRHFGTGELAALRERGFLTPVQLRLLNQGQEFLRYLRFALHILTGRREDRLLFDHQSRIAELCGYKDGTYMLAVEQLMQKFYRTVMELSRLNEMMLQLFQEAILLDPKAEPQPLNPRFNVKNGFLQIADDDVFERDPSALLEIFLILQQTEEIQGVAAKTITVIRRDLYLIDDAFRQDPRNQALFLQILRAPEGVTHELRRMNLYGVLGRYIPAFGRIVGRMQYDLFHTYTVDAHTLFVVSNLRRFALSRFDHEFPLCSEIMQGLARPELAYLAGLFHDIAKGRGGDHSELGAVEAETFCREHGMSEYDARLVAWLVRHHLLLSLTAQKKDLGDPEVIRDFAQIVGDELRLDYLYVLTVADVRATNPELWNSWRAQLFAELRRLARQALRRGLAVTVDKEQLLAARKEEARQLLNADGIAADQLERIWRQFSEDYFLRCRPEEIHAHSRLLAEPGNEKKPIVVDVREQSVGGGTAAFLFTPQERFTFATATAVFDEMGLNVTDARIVPLLNDRSLATFVVLEADGTQPAESRRIQQIRHRLEQAMHEGPLESPTISRRVPRQIRMFPTKPLVSFANDERNQRTVMEIVTGDRPGMLCEIGKILRDREIRIQTAKIVTVGERAEDVFYITDQENRPVTETIQAELTQTLETALAAPGKS